ncbi:[Fe-Fe] hydrogenase large subunit C-terminal domain-containing protein [Candidatus Soleaferrea massiliensis]|uniref:[Fe-Fe] hydrogenase large subunit C-terminal domain-containing protein n=1 Tax=Candidatus Soleaferrea massiliensis TaxID=1470354 RepID=UPI00058EE919|nr:[Fe-Fe] hydrogenase large subunit C-terminal domain-containing protein [Candidatus Soleaferrea massiliensis]
MDIIQLTEANCKNCHKCIRNCLVKSIRFSNEQAKIIEDDCILCGHCFIACPQNAKYIKSDVEEIRGWLSRGEDVYISLAPSFVSAFPDADFAKMSAALKKLGFKGVEETAIGAGHVSDEFGKLMEAHEMDNIITTCCPTIVLLVEKHFPELVKYLAPVVSPAMAHAKLMKEKYGGGIKVVFAGPCISKKYEAQQNKGIDAVLMFEELHDLFRDRSIQLDRPDESPSEIAGTVNRLYPIPGGIIDTIPQKRRENYKCVAIDGLDRCIEILQSLEKNAISGYFFEMNSCAGSCVEGPGLRDFEAPFLLAKENVVAQANKETRTPAPATECAVLDFSETYRNKQTIRQIPDEATIRSILMQIGKTTPDTMYNCGACGYPTCREKAIAVYQGKAELRMCIPYMREKAESMSNVILDNTPNAIFLLDADFNIVEFNAAAVKIFNMTDLNYTGLPAQMLLGNEAFEAIGEDGQVCDMRTTLMDGAQTVEQTVIRISDTGNYLAIAKDVTSEERQNKKLAKMREETMETAQRVIDKQMRVAQEIASLLGETTGETKAALTKLKKSMSEGESNESLHRNEL